MCPRVTSRLVAVLVAPFALSAADGAADSPAWPWLLICLAIACGACGALAWLSRLHHRRLVDSRAHYRHLVDLAEGWVVFRTTVGADGRGRLELASRSLEKIVGFPIEHYQADPGRLLEQIAAGERERIVAALAIAARDATPLRLNVALVHPRFARPRHLMVHAVPTRERGGTTWDGICVDLTAEAEAEEERRNLTQQLELARRHESLGLLAGGVAHDFNNLLGAIRGNAELVLPAIAKDKVASHRLNRLVHAVDRATGLVRQILAYTGKGAVEVKPVHIEHEIRALKNLLKHSLPNQARVALAIEHGLPPVLMDPVQFQQVLLNLLMNAAESYTAPGGAITVTLARDAGRLRLDVADQGCGMDEATIARMFEPYFTTKRDGHGLGLAAVKGIVDRAGGTLSCRSAPGKGTIFSLFFVATAPRATRITTRTAPAVGGAARSVLVVDDDELVGDATSAMVAGLGFTVVAATGGAEALTLLLSRRAEFSAMVIDCRMRDVDGASVLRQLRAGGDRMPVVMVSGMIGSNDLSEELSDKRTRFLAKPFTQQQLAEALSALHVHAPSESSSQVAAVEPPKPSEPRPPANAHA